MARPNIFINCKVKSNVKSRIMKKWINRFIKYYRNPKNEFGFMVLSLLKKWTTLPVNIFIDDSGTWTNIGNKKIILFQTDKNKVRNFNKIIPISISDEPEILIKNTDLELSTAEVEQIKNFIRKCKNEIIQIAEDKISHLEFGELLTKKGYYKENDKAFSE